MVGIVRNRNTNPADDEAMVAGRCEHSPAQLWLSECDQCY